ncbi:MAG: prephenate dehydrogenase [Clostridiales bacterium]|nr:prephenate dehydrogenase [Clostridiales bacterium]
MKIAVIGLGLIGGSLCKSIKKNTSYTVMGFDINPKSVKKALEQEAIDIEMELDDLEKADITIVALYPEQTVDFIKNNPDKFKKGSIVTDTCGIKEYIVESVTDILAEKSVTFIGAHPMAGREFSGFDYSVDNLFEKASFIITPTKKTPMKKLEQLEDFALAAGFFKVVLSSPQEHDKVIAFTSQLAHIVSNAYVKSPSLKNESGFSAGSFLDLTRVARLNEEMWSDLFLLNKKPLEEEIETIIKHLEEYNKALKENNKEELKKLLRIGRQLKEQSMDYYNSLNS